MIVSSKGRYAVRAMIDLAQNGQEKPVSLTEVANRQQISQKYLEAVVRPLLRDGLVKSKMGKYGGYQLERKPKEYTLYEILKTAEDTLESVSCEGMECSRSQGCITLPVWQELDSIIEDYFKKITLQEVLDGKVKKFYLK